MAELWHAAWHQAHDRLVDPRLVAARTRANFAGRLPAMVGGLRVIGPHGAPLAMCVAQGDLIAHLFVAPAAQGQGLGQRLLRDAETRIRAQGFAHAHLQAMIGNHRAIGFYRAQGWHETDETRETLRLAQGPARGPVEIFSLRFEKQL